MTCVFLVSETAKSVDFIVADPDFVDILSIGYGPVSIRVNGVFVMAFFLRYTDLNKVHRDLSVLEDKRNLRSIPTPLNNEYEFIIDPPESAKFSLRKGFETYCCDDNGNIYCVRKWDNSKFEDSRLTLNVKDVWMRMIPMYRQNDRDYVYLSKPKQGGDQFAVDRFIFETCWHGKYILTPKHKIAHIDGNLRNCRPDNLELEVPNYLKPKPVKETWEYARSKVTPVMVHYMRGLRTKEFLSIAEITRVIGNLSYQTVYNIVSYKSWLEVPFKIPSKADWESIQTAYHNGDVHWTPSPDAQTEIDEEPLQEPQPAPDRVIGSGG